jgi:surface protein
MTTYDNYSDKHSHLKISEEEMRRKYYKYLEEQEMPLNEARQGAASSASAAAAGGPSPKERRPQPDFNVNPFTSTWKTDNAGASSSNQIQIPTIPNGNYYFKITWGDGNEDIITDWNQKELRHTYETGGTYEVNIYGTFEGFSFGAANSNGGDQLKILDVSSWGSSFMLQSSAFLNCSNLDISATDAPKDIETLGLFNTFFGCSSLTTVPGISTWDTSKCTLFYNTFRGCTNFNGDVSTWNTSNCTNLYYTFNGCTNFNQDISSWDMSNCNTMLYSFGDTISFNQDISAWDVSKVVSFQGIFQRSRFNQNINEWNTSSATSMFSMFRENSVFNQPLNNWDVSKVTNMRGMFRGSTSFNQDISSWNVSNVTDFTDFLLSNGVFNQDLSSWPISGKVTTWFRAFTSPPVNFSLASWDVSGTTNLSGIIRATTFSSANYSATLIGWAAQPFIRPNTVFAVGSVQYTAEAAAARATLVDTYGWTITDGGEITP